MIDERNRPVIRPRYNVGVYDIKDDEVLIQFAVKRYKGQGWDRGWVSFAIKEEIVRHPSAPALIGDIIDQARQAAQDGKLEEYT